jgi:hypothetical protein
MINDLTNKRYFIITLTTNRLCIIPSCPERQIHASSQPLLEKQSEIDDEQPFNLAFFIA